MSENNQCNATKIDEKTERTLRCTKRAVTSDGFCSTHAEFRQEPLVTEKQEEEEEGVNELGIHLYDNLGDKNFEYTKSNETRTTGNQRKEVTS